MANAISGNKMYVDSTGLLIAQAQTRVSYINFTPATAADSLVITESASGPNCLVLQGAVAHQSTLYDFSEKPLVFNNAVYIKTLTAGATATIVTTQGGG